MNKTTNSTKNMEYRIVNIGKGKNIKSLYSIFYIPYSSPGFTFVETLVAIAILLLSITAPLTLASQGLAASRIARDHTIATYLSQEAIEYVRNTRDSNVLQGNDWLTSLDICNGASGCSLDVSKGSIDACSEKDGCDPLSFDPDTGLYTMGDAGSDAAETKFTRMIIIEEMVPDVEAHVRVTLTWKDGVRDRTLTIEERLLNWQ